jgi:hypothetical protein
MPHRIPAFVAALAGILVVLDRLLISRPLNALVSGLIDAAIVIGVVALLLGVVNVAQVHWTRILREQPGQQYSWVLLVSMLTTIVVGLINGSNGGVTAWIVTNIYRPLGASFFALVAFFIVTAVYRAGTRRTSGSMVLFLITTMLVLIGLAPLDVLRSNAGGLPLVSETLDALLGLRAVSDWLLNYPSVALQRGIVISTALGATLATLRILLGMDRHYLE